MRHCPPMRATAYIPFKSNSTGKSRGSYIWSKMYHYFHYNQDEFMQHYHKRSNVETTFFRYKTVIGPAMRSRNLAAQRVEARIGCQILNRIAALGMPDGQMIG